MNSSLANQRHSNTGLFQSLLVALALLPLAGCQLPNFMGPQIQEPPQGFLRESRAGQNRKMFPAWERIHHDAWVNASWGYVSTIHINGYPGVVMRADVQSALEDAMASEPDPVTYSGVQEMVIDGRQAWGWAERLQTEELGLQWIAFYVAIPYDTITYTVELLSGDPALKGSPDTLLTIAATFGIGETRWNYPLIIGVIVVLTVIILMARKQHQAKQARMRNITLKKVEKPKKDEEKKGVPKPGGGPIFTPSTPPAEESKPSTPEAPPEREG